MLLFQFWFTIFAVFDKRLIDFDILGKRSIQVTIMNNMSHPSMFVNAESIPVLSGIETLVKTKMSKVSFSFSFFYYNNHLKK